MGFDGFYPLEAFNFHDTGLRHNVKSLGHRASPCGSPLLKWMMSDVSIPCLVLTVIFVFQLWHSLFIVLHNQDGNLCRNIISSNHSWLTLSKAFLTSIQAILTFFLLFLLSLQTILSTNNYYYCYYYYHYHYFYFYLVITNRFLLTEIEWCFEMFYFLFF